MKQCGEVGGFRAREESFSAAGLTRLKDSSRRKSWQGCHSSETLEMEARLGSVKQGTGYRASRGNR